MLTRRIPYRLYPTKAQEQTLYEWRRLHCYLYNSALADRRNSYQRQGKSVNYLDQQNRLPAFKEVWTAYKTLGSQALQVTLKRVDLAYQHFFAGKAAYPRFKSIRHYSGWTYPAISGWKALTDGKNGYLDLLNLGKIQMRGQARQWGIPTTCTILNRHGKWYASITVNCEVIRETGEGAIGLDFGVHHAIATSNSEIIEAPKFLAKTAEKIKKASKQKRRKQSPNYKQKIKASKRWKKAQTKVSKLTRKVARQRQDWVHQASTKIVSSNSLICTEQLNLKGMTRKAKQGSKRKAQKTGLNRNMLDVGIGMLKSAIQYKVTEAGDQYLEIPTQTAKPSQTCPNCGDQHKKDLSERIHHCSKCGYTTDRDVAAAQVMLNWVLYDSAVFGTNIVKRGGQSATSKATLCGSMKQLGSKKRQKHALLANGDSETPHAVKRNAG
ncbi:Putative transposaseS891/IS1136/IS1341 family protein [Tumidithrix helvetica PCC 7403]|uniref:RNA-guided endonuclease InsQ/TnpB family protein n=1 Tax=Tumidithrix helvetica TaxID=3457545 RepID=UPI003CAE6C2D